MESHFKVKRVRFPLLRSEACKWLQLCRCQCLDWVRGTCLCKSKQFTVSTLTMWILCLLGQQNTFSPYIIKCSCTDHTTERSKGCHHTSTASVSTGREKFGYSHSKDQPHYASEMVFLLLQSKRMDLKANSSTRTKPTETSFSSVIINPPLGRIFSEAFAGPSSLIPTCWGVLC